MGGGHFTKETIVLLKWSKTRNELLYSSMIIINRVVKQRLRQTRVVKKLFKTNIRTPSDRRRDHRRAFDADTDADVHPNDVLLLLLLWPNFVYSFPPLSLFPPSRVLYLRFRLRSWRDRSTRLSLLPRRSAFSPLSFFSRLSRAYPDATLTPIS